MKEIPLSRGYKAIVDDDDYEWLSQWKWHAQLDIRSNCFWARRLGEDGTIYSMHRVIMNAPLGFVVDHINHNILDNRKCNLRVCTVQENRWNSKKRNDNKTGYKGVIIQRGLIYMIFRTENARKFVRCSTLEEAARLYDEYAQKFFGEFAYLNFPRQE